MGSLPRGLSKTSLIWCRERVGAGSRVSPGNKSGVITPAGSCWSLTRFRASMPSLMASAWSMNLCLRRDCSDSLLSSRALDSFTFLTFAAGGSNPPTCFDD